MCLVQDLDEEYEAALERRRLEVEAERRMQEEEDARSLRALTPQQELPGKSFCSEWAIVSQISLRCVPSHGGKQAVICKARHWVLWARNYVCNWHSDTAVAAVHSSTG